MNSNGRTGFEPPGVAASISGMTRDAVELAELQAQLLACDLRQSGRRAQSSLVFGLAGVCLLLSAFPILLIALAVLLNESIGWPAAAGYAVAGVAGLLTSGGILWLAYSRFKAGLLTLDRSREELARNIEWFKAQLARKRSSNDRV